MRLAYDAGAARSHGTAIAIAFVSVAGEIEIKNIIDGPEFHSGGVAIAAVVEPGTWHRDTVLAVNDCEILEPPVANMWSSG